MWTLWTLTRDQNVAPPEETALPVEKGSERPSATIFLFAFGPAPCTTPLLGPSLREANLNVSSDTARHYSEATVDDIPDVRLRSTRGPSTAYCVSTVHKDAVSGANLVVLPINPSCVISSRSTDFAPRVLGRIATRNTLLSASSNCRSNMLFYHRESAGFTCFSSNPLGPSLPLQIKCVSTLLALSAHRILSLHCIRDTTAATLSLIAMLRKHLRIRFETLIRGA